MRYFLYVLDRQTERYQNRLLREVQQRIATLASWIKEKTAQAGENPSINSFHSPTLLELLNKSMRESGVQQSRYGKIRDLKAYVQAVSFLQDKNVTTLKQLQDMVLRIKKQYCNTYSRIKQTEKLLRERKELIEQSKKYLKYSSVYEEYKKQSQESMRDIILRTVPNLLYRKINYTIRYMSWEARYKKPKHKRCGTGNQATGTEKGADTKLQLWGWN